MKNSAQIILFFFISAVIGIAALYVFFSLDIAQWNMVQAARLQVAERQAVRDQIANLLSQFRERVAQFENLDQQITLIDHALPSSMNIPELLTTIETIATKNHVSLDQITFTAVSQLQQPAFTGTSRPAAQQTKPFEIVVSMTVSGGYSAIKDFITMLESEVRLIDTTALTMTPASDSSKPAQFSLHIDATTYYTSQPTFTLP